MDKNKVTEALKKFSAALPETPEWIILVTVNGEFLSRIGDYPYFYLQPIDDTQAAKWTHAHGTHLLNTLEHLNHGGLDFSITFGGNRTFFLFHLNYALFLGITYNGVKSLDAIIEAVHFNSLEILEAVNPSHPA